MKNLQDSERRSAFRLRAEGWTVAEIAVYLGYSRRAVRYALASE